jgi:hypothetical protein
LGILKLKKSFLKKHEANMENQINVLFSFHQEAEEGDVAKGRYRILMSYDKAGEVLMDSSQEQQTKQEFHTKESLVEYIQDYIDESGHEKGCLIAANDFNIGLESCHSTDEFSDLFVTHGSLIQPTNHKDKKSFFGKLF